MTSRYLNWVSIARTRDAQHAGFCPEALSQLGAKREGGSYQPPPPARPRYGKWPARARVKTRVKRVKARDF